MTKDILELDTEDDISAEDVKAYLAESENESETPTQEQNETDTIQPASQDNNRVSYSFQADEIFSETPKAEEIQAITVAVNAHEIEVTQTDQTKYLKAILNDTPVELDVDVLGGSLKVTCRALSVSETEWVITTVLKYFDEHKNLNGVLMTDYVRQLRTALQLVKLNGKSPYPAIVVSSDLTQDEIFNGPAWKFVRGLSTVKYNAIAAALNVFEHKVTRMNSAALNEDFWHPGETD